MPAPDRLNFGLFLAPFHRLGDNPTYALERDLELTQHLDRLGFDEAWFGEHHSGGYETYASPELFIASAAERTKHIRLGTGVISLPYHNPFMVADRMMQLDFQTRGRAMFGFGPGLLVSDAMMLGIDPDTQRHRMAEALTIIMRLLDGEVVTHKSDWFELREARLHIKSFTRPRPEIAVTSTITPNGAKLAGQYGLGMLCVAAASAAGYNVLDTNWRVANDIAAQRGGAMDPAGLRLMAPIYVAETREQAVADLNWGFKKYLHYSYSLRPEGPVAIGLPTEITMESIEKAHAGGHASFGTPDDAVALIEKFWKKTGGFGAILILAHDWANFENTKKSLDMFARYVLPKFAGRNTARDESLDWIRGNREAFAKASKDAAMKMVNQFLADEAAKKQTAAE